MDDITTKTGFLSRADTVTRWKLTVTLWLLDAIID